MRDNPFFILIAQDDENDRHLMKKMLCEHFTDWQYHMVSNERTLLQYLLTKGEQSVISLLLIDISLSQENELTTVAQVRGMTKYDSLPVVAFSDSVYPAMAEMFLELGGNAYFQKPTSMDENLQIFSQLPLLASTGSSDKEHFRQKQFLA